MIFRFLFFILTTHHLSGQSSIIDSLKGKSLSQKGRELVQSYNELSWHYKSIDLDSSVLYAQMALDESIAIKSDSAISASYNSLGNAMEAKGLIDSAMNYHLRSLAIKEVLFDTIGIANSLNNIGILYDETGRYVEALNNYFRSLKYYELYGDKENTAMVLINIGIVYKKQQEYERVLQYYLQALQLYDQLNNDFGRTVISGNIGSVYINLHKYDSSIFFSKKALEGYDRLGYTRYIPYIQENIAIATDSIGNLEQAIVLYEEAIKGHLAYENHYELANVYLGLGTNYLKQGKSISAQNAAKEGLKHAHVAKANDFAVKLHALLAKSLAQTGNYKDAYYAFEKHLIGKDSLYETEKVRQIFELETQYETEKKEQRIALQQSQIAEEQAKNQLNLIVIAGLLLTLTLSIVIIILIRSRSLKKEQILRQEANLKLKEAEIEFSIRSQERERARFAKDLHDGFGQMISILNLNLKSLEKPDVDRHEIYENSSEVLDQMYKELKGICFDLMPQTLIQHGLTSAVDEFASRINKSGQIAVETDFFGMEARLTDVQEISLYRIIQEWVNNILKYGEASHVLIQITRESSSMSLLIEDNGSGFDPNLLTAGKGNGWRNIQSRANLIKGEINLDTSPGRQGNTLIIDCDLLHTDQINMPISAIQAK